MALLINYGLVRLVGRVRIYVGGVRCDKLLLIPWGLISSFSAQTQCQARRRPRTRCSCTRAPGCRRSPSRTRCSPSASSSSRTTPSSQQPQTSSHTSHGNPPAHSSSSPAAGTFPTSTSSQIRDPSQPGSKSMSSKAAASWAYALARTLPVPRSGLMSEAVWKLPGREISCVFLFFFFCCECGTGFRQRY